MDLINYTKIKRIEKSLNRYIRQMDIPIIKFIGNEGMTKDTATDLEMFFISDCVSFRAVANMKWQGHSSLVYPKKNYTIKLYTDHSKTEEFRVDLGWGAQSKYCLKADYMDASHARNVVSAKLWGQVVATRKKSTPLSGAPNYGAIDGFPIIVYMNGKYKGLYNWNIPKEGWLFNMDENNSNHAFVIGEIHDGSCAFLENAVVDGSDWELEFPDVLSQELLDSFNSAIDHVKDSSDEDFVAHFDNYIDLEATIDHFIFSFITCNLDSVARDLIMATYDGQKWIPSVYDFDSTWGIHFAGDMFFPCNLRMPEDYYADQSLLWIRTKQLFADKIFERYAELRKAALSYFNVIKMFGQYFKVVTLDLYNKDLESYPDIPSADIDFVKQIEDFAWDRIRYVDNQMRMSGGYRNLFDNNIKISNILIAPYNNGEEITHGDYYTTGYIPVDRNHTHTLSGINEWAFLNYFDMDREWLGGTEGTGEIKLWAPNNAVYARLSCHKRNDEYIQFERSDGATPYQKPFMF